jgi:hypothetical protein
VAKRELGDKVRVSRSEGGGSTTRKLEDDVAAPSPARVGSSGTVKATKVGSGKPAMKGGMSPASKRSASALSAASQAKERREGDHAAKSKARKGSTVKRMAKGRQAAKGRKAPSQDRSSDDRKARFSLDRIPAAPNPLVAAFEAGRRLNRLDFHLEQAFFFGTKHDQAALRVLRTLTVLLNHLVPDGVLDRVQLLVADRLRDLLSIFLYEGHVDDLEAAEDRLNETRGDRDAVCARLLEPVFEGLDAIRTAITAHLDERLKKAFRLGERVDRLVCPFRIHRQLYEPDVDPALLEGSYEDVWATRQPLVNVSRWPGEVCPEPDLVDQIEDLGQSLQLPDTMSACVFPRAGSPTKEQMDQIVTMIRKGLGVLQRGVERRCVRDKIVREQSGKGPGQAEDVADSHISSRPAKPGQPESLMAAAQEPRTAATRESGDTESRLRFEDSTWTIHLDGRPFPGIEPLAFKRFKVIANSLIEGRRINDDELPGKGRVGRHLKNHLPRKLFAIIDRRSGKGGGSRLMLPQRSPRKASKVHQ